MTQFKDLELLYKQFFNLTNEIASMVENEEIQAISEKLVHKERLIKKLANAKKTTKLSQEEIEKTDLMEKELREKEQANIDSLVKMRDEIGNELRTGRKKLKINTAYSATVTQNQGVFVDLEE
jgi:hypothetical protein